MSRLSRVLHRQLKNLKGEAYIYTDSIQDWLDHNKFISSCRDWYYSLKAFFSNLPMFVRFAWRYRSWDYIYNVEVFVTLIENTGKTLRKHGNALNSEKYARRAFTAAGLLRKAYLEGYNDKTLLYLNRKNPYTLEGCSFKRTVKTEARIYEGMVKIAREREMRVEQEMKADAWVYIHKYLEYFWD